jgi:peptidoglycan/LPS O-acetylase OafA/YrhL/lysophospholipase L1-like esterase
MRHLPALDGLRGIAVTAVLLFHGGFAWAKGGWLGVSVFFTLSGFLITNLLVAEWDSERTISLRTFWSRRFRRLMPAALACLLLVALYGWLFASPEQLRNLRGDLLAALGYVANWRFLFAKLSYADLFSAPSPVQHFWSLAIEEQFYVAFPLVVFLALRLGGRRLLGAVLGVTVAASLVVAYVERANLDRVYYGTDTRMAELLAGGLLALWWSSSPTARDAARTSWRRLAVALLGAGGLAGSLLLWPAVSQTSDVVTRGVLPLQALLSVAVITAAARPGIVSRVLSFRGFTALGLVSYGLYLYHWPIFLMLDQERTGLSRVPLFGVRVAATGVAAVLSYHVLEQPIRRRRVLLVRRSVGSAVLAGVTAVVITAVAVTWAPPRTKIAHANVKLSDATVTVDTVAPDHVIPPAAGAPSSIMIIGDSGTFDAAPGIGAVYKDLGTTTVIDASFPGFGLTREPVAWQRDWPTLLAEHNPQLVVIMLGGWDEGYVEDHGNGAYDTLLDRTVSVLTARGAHILWLGMLPGPGTRTQAMNARFKAVAERHPETVAYGEIDEVLVDADGQYPRWIPGDDGRLLLVRKPDGWHVCPDGAARIATKVAQLTAWIGLSPPPGDGWQQGDWRTTQRYDDPKGGCDPTAKDNAPPGS